MNYSFDIVKEEMIFRSKKRIVEEQHNLEIYESLREDYTNKIALPEADIDILDKHLKSVDKKIEDTRLKLDIAIKTLEKLV